MVLRLLHRLRAGDLAGPELVRLVAVAVMAATAVLLARMILLAPAMVDATGSPVAHDFSLFYSVGQVARGEGVAAVYDLARLGRTARALFGENAFVAVWPYPPPMASVMAWFGVLPYQAALVLWTVVPLLALLAWFWGATRSLPALLLLAGAPVLLLNTVIGQAAPIFSLLLAAGLLAVARRQASGGLAIGVLALKPHLALLVPAAFLAAGAWRAIAMAGVVALAILAGSVLLQGPEPWLAWFESVREAGRLTLAADVDSRMPGVQAGARMLGAGPVLAQGLQAVSALAALAIVALVWRRSAAAEDKAAVALLGAPLAPPYLWFYDCLVVAVAIALIAARAARDGWRPWEKVALAAAWLAPAINLVTGARAPLPVMAVAGIVAFWVVARGVLANSEAGEGRGRVLPA